MAAGKYFTWSYEQDYVSDDDHYQGAERFAETVPGQEAGVDHDARQTRQRLAADRGLRRADRDDGFAGQSESDADAAGGQSGQVEIPEAGPGR